MAAWSLFHQVADGGSIPTSALDFRFEVVDMRTAQRLNKEWHSLLPRTDLGNLLCGSMSVAYVAIHDGFYFAVSIYSQPIIRSVASDGKTIELRRLAVCDDAPKNMASRMMAVTCRLIKQKWPYLEKVVSYLAVDVHDGTIYKAAGWGPVGKIVDARPQRVKGDKNRATGPLQTKSRKQRWEKLL